MARFLNAHASGTDWRSLCNQAIAVLGDPRPGRDLGFVYITDVLADHAAEIAAYLRRSTGVSHWVGSVGSGIVATGVEVYDTPAISLLLSDLTEDQFRVIPRLTDDISGFLASHRSWIDRNQSAFCVVHGDPRQARISEHIAQLAQGLDGGFLVGGLSSSGREQFVQIADGTTDGGLSGVLLAGGVQVATGVSQGCSLIGRRHEVSKAEAGVIAELDGRPALDVFVDDIGPALAQDLGQTAGVIFAAIPVPGSDTGDYLVRNLLGFDPENRLLAVGELLREGMGLQFARRDRETAREDLVRALRRVKSRLGGEAKGAVYFSCLGRGRNLFGDHSAELRLVQQELGDTPLTGFYANGEISHNRLYGYTGVIALFPDTD